MFPPPSAAASFVPLLDEVMQLQVLALPTEVRSVQVAPESAEVQMFPALLQSPLTAASFVPSLDDVMLCHFFVLPTEVSSVQVLKRFKFDYNKGVVHDDGKITPVYA